jgi:hypothetical protein
VVSIILSTIIQDASGERQVSLDYGSPGTQSMKQTKYFKCACAHCGGRIEFPAELVGQSCDCPHCQRQTELTLPPPPELETEHTSPRSGAWIVAGVVILLIGVVGSAVAMMWLKRVAARNPRHQTASAAANPNGPPGPPAATKESSAINTNSLTVSRIALDKPKGSTLVYATGILKNQSDRQRFGVKVELDLFDKADVKIGTASDYQQLLEPKAEWRFRALVIEPKATSAKLAAIKEDQ